MGTWLGITRTGRFAAVTNVREPGVVVDKPISRGELTKGFLVGDEGPEAYLRAVAEHGQRYAGFNLLLGRFGSGANELLYYSNRQEQITELKAGIYGLSNHLLDSPWPKVEDGKAALAQQLRSEHKHSTMRQLLENPQTAADPRLPDTGIQYEREKALSASFITLPDYGTRATTVITIETNTVVFSECNYLPAPSGEALPSAPPAEFQLSLK